MTIDYDDFRRTTWDERVALFSALSPDEKAELVRSQIAGWLHRHRMELTEPQVRILEEAIELTSPAMYGRGKPDPLAARMKDLENRARGVLTHAQVIDALTMQWGMT